MAASLHPSAVVDAGAELADGVTVGPHCVVEAGVRVGRDTRLLAGTILMTGTRIGAGSSLGPYASIGGEPMDTAFAGEASGVEIGDRVQVREFVTVHRATGVNEATRVGSGSLLMSNVHVGHNVRIYEAAVITAGSQLGGHSEVGAHAVIGAATNVHQFVRVGTLSMTGGMSGLNRDVLPYSLAVGKFAEHYGLNRVGLRRAGVTGERYARLEAAFRHVRRREVAQLEELAAESEDVRLLVDFIASGTRGIARFRGRGR